jgi:hypothetical protein
LRIQTAQHRKQSRAERQREREGALHDDDLDLESPTANPIRRPHRTAPEERARHAAQRRPAARHSASSSSAGCWLLAAGECRLPPSPLFSNPPRSLLLPRRVAASPFSQQAGGGSFRGGVSSVPAGGRARAARRGAAQIRKSVWFVPGRFIFFFFLCCCSRKGRWFVRGWSLAGFPSFFLVTDTTSSIRFDSIRVSVDESHLVLLLRASHPGEWDHSDKGRVDLDHHRGGLRDLKLPANFSCTITTYQRCVSNCFLLHDDMSSPPFVMRFVSIPTCRDRSCSGPFMRFACLSLHSYDCINK